MNEIRIADTDQRHSFWITIWNYLKQFEYVLSLEEMQKAITSINQTKKHPFWSKLKEAMWTLVIVPKEVESVRFHSKGDTYLVETRKWLDETSIEVPPELKKEFPSHQRPMFGATNHVRSKYVADDLFVLGYISRIFPELAETPFRCKELEEGNIKPYTLTRIEQFVREADEEDVTGKAICDSSSENIFFVQGRKGLLMVSVRRKLDTWRMSLVRPGDTFRGIDVYVFI